MSSHLTQLAWKYGPVKVEDKLLLLALAEIADNKGNFQTSVEELHQLTGMAQGVISTVLRHFISSNVSLIQLNPNQSKSNPVFSGVLCLEGQSYISESEREQIDLLAQVQQQQERLNANKQNSKGKLNRMQRAQVSPLNSSSSRKQYNVIEIHMEEIHEWAEGIMFQKGVRNTQEVWNSLVEDVHASGEKIFELDKLINRLHQKIDYFKDLSFRDRSSGKAKPVRQSALSSFEEKAANYMARFDD